MMIIDSAISWIKCCIIL